MIPAHTHTFNTLNISRKFEVRWLLRRMCLDLKVLGGGGGGGEAAMHHDEGQKPAGRLQKA